MRRHIKSASGEWHPKSPVAAPVWSVEYAGKSYRVSGHSPRAVAYFIAETIGRKSPNTRWPVEFSLSREGRAKVHKIQVDAVHPEPEYVLTLID